MKILTKYWLTLNLALAACAPAAGQAVHQPPRPEPLRLAGGDYPVGAHNQPLDDTLNSSATQKGLAPGWRVENGTLKYDKEARLRATTSRPPSKADCEAARKLVSEAGAGNGVIDGRCPPAP